MQSATLSSSTQHVMHAKLDEKLGERTVLILGSLCLPCCVRDTVKKQFFFKFTNSSGSLDWSIILHLRCYQTSNLSSFLLYTFYRQLLNFYFFDLWLTAIG